MEYKILFVLTSSCGLSKKLKSPRVKAIWECYATTQSEAKNWCAPVFYEKDIQSVVPLWQCETKNCGNGWNAALPLYFVAFVPSYLLFLVMFLIECFLYESNTTCASSCRSYFYSMMYTGKRRYENDYAFHQCRSKIHLLVLAQGTEWCAGFSWLDGIHNSHVCYSVFKHQVNMYQIVLFTLHWDERTE